jgi:hypothetical protein
VRETYTCSSDVIVMLQTQSKIEKMIILHVFFSLYYVAFQFQPEREREKLLIIYRQHPLIMTGRGEQGRLRTTEEKERRKRKRKK